METNEKTERIKIDNWVSRNLILIFMVFVVLSHKFVEQWVSFSIYAIAAVLIYTNVLYFVNRRYDINAGIIILDSWVKTNLAVLALITVFSLTFFILGKLLDYLGGFVPEGVSTYFLPVLVVVGVLYLIGLGFRLVEKVTKN